MLRSKTVQAALDAAAQVLFEAPERVAWIGAPSRAGSGLATLDELAQGTPGVVWQVEGDLRPGLIALRCRLQGGARLLLSVRLVPSAWRRLGAGVSGHPLERRSRESVFEALLLAGLKEPRVWLDHPHHLCVSAELPNILDPLDHAFTQPAEAVVR